MHVSRSTEPIIETAQITNTLEELGRRRRQLEFASTNDSVDDGSLLRDLRETFVLTLSPREGNKLALKYENVDCIKLYPDSGSKLAADAEPDEDDGKPLMRSIVQNYYTVRNELENLRLSLTFLAREKETLTSKKTLLEEKLKLERTKNDSLKTYNEGLHFHLFAVAAKTLELSIDKQLLEDEVQRITWGWNYKFLLPWRHGGIYRKL